MNKDKKRIKQYFNNHPDKRFIALDLEDELGIHMNKCEEILAELVQEGEIEIIKTFKSSMKGA